MSLILDSSVALAWTFADEMTVATQNVASMVAAAGARVPALWRLEIANSLQIGMRRGRIDGAFRHAALLDLARLPIQIDPLTNDHAWTTIVSLADRHRLTAYDASHLELAVRRRLPLATLDQRLRVAAISEGILLLGL